MAKNLVRNGRILEANGNHLLLGHVAPLANGFADFDRLAQADADAPLLVAGDNEGAEAETAPAFDNLGGTVDEDDFLAQFLAGFRPGCRCVALRRCRPVAARAAARTTVASARAPGGSAR